MKAIFASKNSCLEYKYWSKKEVSKLVEFLLVQDKFIFLKASEIIATYSTKLSLIEIIQQIFPTLTSKQELLYRKRLEYLSNLLANLYDSAENENELGTFRTAVIEKFIHEFFSIKYPSNCAHHCTVQIDEKLIDKAKDIDVAGWELDNGEFTECKAGDFDYESEKTKLEFLIKLKRIVKENGLVSITVLDLTDQTYIDDYKKDGIDYCDRRCIAEKYLQ